MPCMKCSDGKWRYGNKGKCEFHTKEKCESAESAIHIRENGGSVQENCGKLASSPAISTSSITVLLKL